jgi:hypothetical protein
VARATARASHARAVVTVTVTVTPLSRFPQRKLKLNAPLLCLLKPAAAAAGAAARRLGVPQLLQRGPRRGPPAYAMRRWDLPNTDGPTPLTLGNGRVWAGPYTLRPRLGTNQPTGFKLSVGAAADRAPAREAAAVAAPGPRRAFPLAAESTRLRSVPVAVHYCIYSQLGRGPTNLSIVQMLGLLRVGYAAASSYHHRHAKRALNRAQAATSCRCAECVPPVPRTIEPVSIELASMLQGARR